MEWMTLGLLLLVLIVAVWGALRNGAAALPDLARMESRLEELEHRIHERIGETRSALDQSVREIVSTHVRELSSLREILANRFWEVGSKLEAQNREAQKMLQELLSSQLRELRESSSASLRELREASSQSLADLRTGLDQRLASLQEQTAKSLGDVQQKVSMQLDGMRRDNEAKLERIRETVDEKLQTTLEKRLGESFRIVSERLESVQKGLGEMQALANGVGDLKKVLTNVSTRGALGEMQLGRILEDVMDPSQYVTNCATVPGSSERVEFAIRLPGRKDDSDFVLLPIDAKFPTEDYQRLLDAYEAGEKDQVAKARSGFAARLKAESAKIRAKYVYPPYTTDFAILFVPTEGLYAEALRSPELFEELYRVHNVIICGPSTIVALLNSLQMGFKTLAIEKRSSEVWTMLKAVKTEFQKFANSLVSVEKRLESARKEIGKVGKHTRDINRKLENMESLEATEAEKLLYGEKSAAGEADDEPLDDDE